jgi:hypothetical protein
MHNHGVAVQVACRLHNVCMAEFGEKRLTSISHEAVLGFEVETDHQHNDNSAAFMMYTDGVPCLGQGNRSDLEYCSHREMSVTVV